MSENRNFYSRVMNIFELLGYFHKNIDRLISDARTSTPFPSTQKIYLFQIEPHNRFFSFILFKASKSVEKISSSISFSVLSTSSGKQLANLARETTPADPTTMISQPYKEIQEVSLHNTTTGITN